MANDKVTDRDALIFWDSCAAAALSGVGWALKDSNEDQHVIDVVGAAYHAADLALDEWAEKFGYNGPHLGAAEEEDE